MSTVADGGKVNGLVIVGVVVGVVIFCVIVGIIGLAAILVVVSAGNSRFTLCVLTEQ